MYDFERNRHISSNSSVAVSVLRSKWTERIEGVTVDVPVLNVFKVPKESNHDDRKEMKKEDRSLSNVSTTPIRSNILIAKGRKPNHN